MVKSLDCIDTSYVNKLQEKLNHITFESCEDVLVGDVLYYPIYYMQSQNMHSRCFKNTLRQIKWVLRIIKRVLLNNYQYKNTKDTNSLFLYSSSYGVREDLKKNFCKVVDLLPKSAIAVYDRNINTFSLWKIRYLGLFARWYLTIKRMGICGNGLECVYLLTHLIYSFCDYKDAEHFFGKGFTSIDILVSFCDVHPVDSFFTQMLNAMNKKTVDLMHGSISDKHNSWTVFGVKSKFFIADSQYTNDLLVNNGYNGTVFVCGYPSNINSNFKKHVSDAEKVIGVILSAKDLHHENVSLCNNLYFLKDKGYKIIAKLHPTEKKTDYTSDNLELFEEVFDKNITSSEFLSRINSAIITSSTVVYEAIRYRVPFIFYADSVNFYKAYNMPEVITAGNDVLEEKVSQMLIGKYELIYKQLSDYYTEKGCTKDNYLLAFKKIGIN